MSTKTSERDNIGLRDEDILDRRKFLREVLHVCDEDTMKSPRVEHVEESLLVGRAQITRIHTGDKTATYAESAMDLMDWAIRLAQACCEFASGAWVHDLGYITFGSRNI